MPKSEQAHLTQTIQHLLREWQEGLEFVQRRFSHSRLAVYTLLGFLRKVRCVRPVGFPRCQALWKCLAPEGDSWW